MIIDKMIGEEGMALVNDVKYNGKFKILKEFIDANKPEKKDFFSTYGIKPFDTSLIALRSPKDIEENERGKVGDLSEKYIQVLIAQYCDDKHKLFESIIGSARNSFEYVCDIDRFKELKDYRGLVDKNINSVWQYICGKNISQIEVIQSIHSLGKLFNILIYFEETDNLVDVIYKVFYEPCSLGVVMDVCAIGNIFKNSFINEGILRRDSDVVFSPTFGEWSRHLGAYADLYIDGVLYDIKSSAKITYRGDMVSQIYGYYLAYVLNNEFTCRHRIEEGKRILGFPTSLECESKYDESSLLNKEVHSIALYFSRFGDIEICNLNKCDCSLCKEKVINIANAVVNKLNSQWKEEDLLAQCSMFVMEERK